jgi:hypothetical protein
VKSVSEVETVFEKERTTGEQLLFPIRIDAEVMQTRQAWAADIRRQRNIGDFSSWPVSSGTRAPLAPFDSEPRGRRRHLSLKKRAARPYRVEHMRLFICQSSENSVWVEADLPVKAAYPCAGFHDAWFAAPCSPWGG